MLEIVHGQTNKQTQAKHLADTLSNAGVEGTLYIGYPVISSADEKIEADALLVSSKHGLIAFLLAGNIPRPDDTATWAQIHEAQDRLYFALRNHLSRHEGLRLGRELGVPVQTVTVFPASPQVPANTEGTYCGIDQLPSIVAGFPLLDSRFLRPLQAALQRVTTIKPAKKRASVTRPESRGSILKQIEREIANLDQWQKRAAIESPEGPQRIRGLAGSGKTVVLALKAAYLHARYPDWTIAVTFWSRSLYQQFNDFIRRFSFEHLNDEPNWQNLRVIHAWGDRYQDGIYREIANHCDLPPRDFMSAQELYGRKDAFQGVCAELLAATATVTDKPLYDAVLIDEAQDLPPVFFQLVHRFTREPKRIVWAYDELQKLSEAVMVPTEELFGRDEHMQPRVQLVNAEGQARQDVILPICYRNTPWALTLAHALGFGVYRQDGLIQHFDDPGLWSEIGYHVRSGQLVAGERVELERARTSYPEYFEKLLTPEDAVVSMTFRNEAEQAEWVAQSIERNLRQDELEHDDILIVLPSAYTAKSSSAPIIAALARRGIDAHLAGATTSRDELFRRQSIAIAHIYRSKGNEAPMVYALDCQQCASGHELITLRNTLFTALTRSRAWVRLCGWGRAMDKLNAEIEAVRNHRFRLEFTVPTAGQLEKIRKVHRDRTADEKARIQRAEAGLKEFLEAVRRGDLAIENLPPAMRTGLALLMNEQQGQEDQETDEFE